MRKIALILILSVTWTFASAQFDQQIPHFQFIGIPDSANWVKMTEISRSGDTMCIWDTEKKLFTEYAYNCRLDDVNWTIAGEFNKRCPQYSQVYIDDPGDTSFSTIMNGRVNGHFHHAGLMKYEDGEIADGYYVGWWEEGWSMGEHWGPPYDTEYRYYAKNFFQEEGLSLRRTIVPCIILLIILLAGLFIMKRVKKYPLYYVLVCAVWVVNLILMIGEFLSVEGSFKVSPTQSEEDNLMAATGSFFIISILLAVLSTLNLIYSRNSKAVFVLSIIFVILVILFGLPVCAMCLM